MEKQKFVVEITEEESRELEKAWYAVNSDQNTVAFCMAQPNVNFEAVNEYREVLQKEFAECEMLKSAIAHKYQPEEVELNKFNYSFDFYDKTITFEEQ